MGFLVTSSSRMEIGNPFRVMLSGYGSLLIISTLCLAASASICTQGKQFWSSRLEACANCTECAGGELVVLRPCEIHRDTLCGPISELYKLVQPLHHRHQNHRHNRTSQHHREHHHQQEQQEAASRSPEDGVPRDEVTSTEAPFSRAEALVWDWQAIALTSAIFACILFFLAITLYSLHQAKQWRRLKENFDADVEELSARLCLMAATSKAKGEILEPRLGPITDGNYLDNRCVYLEQLLNVRKDINNKIGAVNGGNVYIEESSSSTTSGKP